MYYFGWKFRIFRDRVFLTILLILKSSRCFILFITNKVIVNTLLHPISIEMLLDRTKKWSNLRKEDLYRGNHVLVLDCFVVQSLSRVQLCDLMDCNTPGFPVLHHLLEFAQTHVHQVSDSIQPSHPLLSPLLPSMFPSIMVFSSEFTLPIRWPKYWTFSFKNSLSNEYLGWTGLISLQSKGLSRVFSSTTVWKHQFFGAQSSI